MQQVELYSFRLTYGLPPPRGSIGSHALSTTGPCIQMLIKPPKCWNKWFSVPRN